MSACDEGDTNKSGQLSIGGSTAHKNPLFSSNRMKSLLAFCRHRLINGHWPDFTKIEDFMSRLALQVE